MTDLRALLGDKYDDVIERAARALSERWNSTHTNESLGRQRMLAGFTLAAVLPDLLAEAWEEGHIAGCADPYSAYRECICGPNPYRRGTDGTAEADQ